MQTWSTPAQSPRLTADQYKAVHFLGEFSEQIVVLAFTGEKPPARPSGLVREIYQMCDYVIAGCLRDGEQPACRDGCSWCCTMRVTATPLEIWYLLDHLQSSLDSREVTALRQRLVEADGITRGMDGRQRMAAKRMCLLNEGGSCLAYAARPIACRFHHSLDADDCQAALEGGSGDLRMRLKISAIGTSMAAGLAQGLRKVGRQAEAVELIAGLHTALEEAEAMSRWLAGEIAL